MSQRHVEKYTVAEDLVKSLEKEDTNAQVLYDLIGRRSECDYTGQLLDGLLEDTPLYKKIEEYKQPASALRSLLPGAKRLYLNSDAIAKNATEVTAEFGVEKILTYSSKRDLVTSKLNLNDFPISGGYHHNDTVYNNSSVVYSLDTVLTYYDFTVSVYDGIHTPGPGHPAPVWATPQLSLDNADCNMVQIDFELYEYHGGGVNDEVGTGLKTRSYMTGILMHPQDIIEQKMMRITGRYLHYPSNDSEYKRVVITASFIGSAFSYNGVPPKVGFFKQNDASRINDSVEPDTSNYIDVMSIVLAGR